MGGNWEEDHCMHWRPRDGMTFTCRMGPKTCLKPKRREAIETMYSGFIKMSTENAFNRVIRVKQTDVFGFYVTFARILISLKFGLKHYVWWGEHWMNRLQSRHSSHALALEASVQCVGLTMPYFAPNYVNHWIANPIHRSLKAVMTSRDQIIGWEGAPTRSQTLMIYGRSNDRINDVF